MTRQLIIGAVAVIAFLLVKDKLPLKQSGSPAKAVEGAIKGSVQPSTPPVKERPAMPPPGVESGGYPPPVIPARWDNPPISYPPPGTVPLVPAAPR